MKLRVAVVNQHPDDVIWGSELQAHLFACALAGRGHEVTYLAMHARTGEPRPNDRPYGIVPLDSASSLDPVRVADAVRSVEADVVYWRMNRVGLDGVARRLSSAPRVPVVLAVAHVNDVSRWTTAPRVVGGARDHAADVRHRLAHRRSWRAFAHVAAVASQREDFLGRVPVELQRYVPNVVDPAIEPFTWPRPYVAWVANLKARKRPELLLPLAGALEPYGLDLFVVGGLQDRRYAHLTHPVEGAPNLHALGLLRPRAAAGVIAGARTLAVTAREEGLSNVLLQAWWHGVPTVSLDYDPDALIASSGAGAVCGGDIGRFHDEVARYASVDDVRIPAGERGAAMARGRFSLATNAVTLEQLLIEVVARGSRSARG